MGGNPITNEVAKKALDKLKAVDFTEKNDPHPTFAVFHEQRIVAVTGIRRSSKKDIPLPHIKKDLGVNARFVLELASCTKYLDDWLRKCGHVKADERDDEADDSSTRDP